MKLSDWLDHRTGYRKLVHVALYEPIPGGSRWRYVWGSTLVFVFAMQLVTGVLLMTAYSPSATTAWSSVWYIQTQMGLGWLIRGMHHFGSQAMVILLPLHILQVVLAKAYRAPREINWWIGVLLMLVVLGLSLTGYLLPWDQKGYWATQVATNIMGLAPVVGSAMQKVVIGGSEYGHLTLTRFFTLHVMVLPGSLIVLLIAHIAVFRRHGITCDVRRSSLGPHLFYPAQAFKDAAACLGVLCCILAAVVVTHVRGDALLDAPADPSASNYPARPEWYFLFLFQMLKYFEGPGMEVLGAIGVPTIVLAVFFAIPLLDKVLWRPLAHAITVLFCVGLFGGAAWLTWQAVRTDAPPSPTALAAARESQAKLKPGEHLTHDQEATLRAWEFNEQRRQANVMAERVLALATERGGIPPGGPLEMIASDPGIRGPQLFSTHCAACHRINGTDGLGTTPAEAASSSDLAGFGSALWIRRLLNDPMGAENFGRMKRADGEAAHTRMSKWIKKTMEENDSPSDHAGLMANFDAVAAYLADESSQPGRLEKIAVSQLAPGSQPTTATSSASAPATAESLSPQELVIRKGRAYFMATCNECHSYGGDSSGTIHAPEMRGYGSVQWIERMIADPASEDLYRSTSKEPAQMPAFRDRLSEKERHLLAVWIHGTQIGSATESK